MTAQTFTITKAKTVETAKVAVKTGPAAAAMIAGGIGCFVVGLGTTLVEASKAMNTALNWIKSVGPLSGKTIIGILAWLISWFLLNTFLKDKDSNLVKAFTLTIILIVAGLLLTFPPFFEIFAGE